MQDICQPIITLSKAAASRHEQKTSLAECGVRRRSSHFYEKKKERGLCWWPRSFTNRLAILKIAREETSHLHLYSAAASFEERPSSTHDQICCCNDHALPSPTDFW